MTDHPLYIKAYIKQKEFTFLVDTGCDRYIMPKKLLGKELLEEVDCKLYAANGTSITVIGEVVLELHQGGEILPTRFIVSNYVAEPILGIEWLRSNGLTWDFRQDLLWMKDEPFELIVGEGPTNCRRVVAVKNVIVPA